MIKIFTREDNFKDVIYAGTMPLEKNQIVFTLSGSYSDQPNRESIQIGPGMHVLDEIGQFMNHNCNPSCKIDGSLVVSLKVLNEGDSITFDYNENEDRMANPFRCHCHNKLIAGKLVPTDGAEILIDK